MSHDNLMTDVLPFPQVLMPSAQVRASARKPKSPGKLLGTGATTMTPWAISFSEGRNH